MKYLSPEWLILFWNMISGSDFRSIWFIDTYEHILTGKRNVTKYRCNSFHSKNKKNQIVVHKLNVEYVKR